MQIYLRQREKHDISFQKQQQQQLPEQSPSLPKFVQIKKQKVIWINGLQSKRKKYMQTFKQRSLRKNSQQKQLRQHENFSQACRLKNFSLRQIFSNAETKQLQFTIKDKIKDKRRSSQKQKVIEIYQNLDKDLVIQTMQIKIPELHCHKQNNKIQKRSTQKQYFQTCDYIMNSKSKINQNFTRAIDKFLNKKAQESFSRTYIKMNNTDYTSLSQTQTDCKKLKTYQKQKVAKQTQRDQNLKKLYKKNFNSVVLGEKQSCQIYQKNIKKQNLKQKFEKKYMGMFMKYQAPNQVKQRSQSKSQQSYVSLLKRKSIFQNQLINKFYQQKLNESKQNLSKCSSKKKVKRVRNHVTLSLKKKFESNLVDRQKSLNLNLIYSKSNPFILVNHLTPVGQKQKKKNLWQIQKKRRDTWKSPDKTMMSTNIAIKIKNQVKSKRSRTQQIISGWHSNNHLQKSIQFEF